MFGKDGPTLFELLRQALCSTQRGYDLLAPKFDATPFRTPREILEPAIGSAGTVASALDLCCGTGAAMEIMAPLTTTRLVGVDFSEGMLALARDRLARTPSKAAIELVLDDVFDITYRQEFSLITCFGALGHILPDQEDAFLGIISRALAPGGRFVFVTGYRPPLLSLRGLVLRAFNTVMRVRNGIMKPPFIMYYLTFLLPDVQAKLQTHGFRVEVQAELFEAPYDRYSLVTAIRL